MHNIGKKTNFHVVCNYDYNSFREGFFNCAISLKITHVGKAELL